MRTMDDMPTANVLQLTFFSSCHRNRFQSLRFLLTNTRVPRETQVQVANVRKMREKVFQVAEYYSLMVKWR